MATWHPLLWKGADTLRVDAERYSLAELERALAQMDDPAYRASGLYSKTKRLTLERVIRKRRRQKSSKPQPNSPEPDGMPSPHQAGEFC